MGESAQGPGPGPAEPQEDAGERERVAEARSPVAPPAPGLPSQIPPWPEAEPKDTRAPDPAGGTPAGAEGAEQPPVEDLGRVDHALPAASEMAAAEASGDAPPLEPKPVSETQVESGAISVAIAGGNIEARGRPMEVLAEVEPPAQQPAAPATLEAREMVPAVDVRPRVSQDARPVPIPEEHIWSGPEAEPPEPPVATPPLPARPHDDAHPEPEPPPLPPAPAAAALLGNPRPAAPAPAAGPVPASSPASVPPSARDGHALPRVWFAVRVAGGAVLALVAAVLLLVILYRWVDPPTSTLMLSQRLAGTDIEQKWVPLERISPNLVQAVILSEDGAFCRHHGVDWSALEEAMESSRGGSTITMQVVKNLFLWPARSYIRKALEIALAYVVEMVWSKERVLEIYLNIAEWGPGVFGAEAAARYHFGKASSRLTAQEAALLAVSLPSPLDRQAGYPGWQTQRLADNLLVRMRAVRTAQRCVRLRRGGS